MWIWSVLSTQLGSAARLNELGRRTGFGPSFLLLLFFLSSFSSLADDLGPRGDVFL